jgi:hypothetical protein
MVLMAYDNPPGANQFRWYCGRNLNDRGIASTWELCTGCYNNAVAGQPGGRYVEGCGWEAAGAAAVVSDVDRDGTQDLVLMAYDDPEGPNTFRYRVFFKAFQCCKSSCAPCGK